MRRGEGKERGRRRRGGGEGGGEGEGERRKGKGNRGEGGGEREKKEGKEEEEGERGEVAQQNTIIQNLRAIKEQNSLGKEIFEAVRQFHGEGGRVANVHLTHCQAQD